MTDPFKKSPSKAKTQSTRQANIPVKTDFYELSSIQTRWQDNDIYGHVNNVVYYSYFDSIVNRFLIKHAQFDLQNTEVIGVMVSSACEFLQSVAYPDELVAGFRVNKVGTTSVEYGLAVFKAEHQQACAYGKMTHVFVNRVTQKPVSIPDNIRKALNKAQSKG